MSAPIGNFQYELENSLKAAKSDDNFPIELKETSENVILRKFEKYFKIHKIEWIRVYLENCHRLNCKASQEADSFKTEGNNFFQKRLYKEAVSKYTQAVMNGPQGTEDLAFAYGNRSAALYRLGLYQECMTDIEEAVQCGFPSASQHKLLLRKVQCLHHLGHVENMKECLDKLQKNISSLELDSKKRGDILKEVKKIQDNMNISDKSAEIDNVEEVPEVSYGPNSVLVQASSAVTMENNEASGRYLVATRNVRAGDTLIVERPFAAVLLPDHYPTHCHNCFQRLHIPYPCRQCTLVRYCSPQCAVTSWDRYHGVECKYLQLLHSVGIAHLSLRIVLVAGLRYLLDFIKKEKELDNKTRLLGLDDDGQYKRNYRSVFDLMTHSDDMTIDDLFQYTMTAKLLLEILRHSGWFVSHTVKEDITSCIVNKSESCNAAVGTSKDQRMCDNVLTDEEISVGGLLLRHILQLVCNAHAITELQCNQSDINSMVDEKSQVRVATAIYPTASLMNHSCDPTIISSFRKDILVVRAVKDVQKGDEIFNCYGPHFKRMGWSERQQCLKEQYFFDCHCKPCIDGEASEALFVSYRCEQCSGPVVKTASGRCFCKDCKVVGFVDEAEAGKGDLLFQKGLSLLQKHKVKEAIAALKLCYTTRKSILYKHNKHLAEVQDCLARCYAMIGEFKTAIEYLRESVHTVEVMYGESSIEFANELQKLSESLIGAQNWTEALEANEKARTIFEKSYGKTHETVKELISTRNELMQVVNR